MKAKECRLTCRTLTILVIWWPKDFGNIMTWDERRIFGTQ